MSFRRGRRSFSLSLSHLRAQFCIYIRCILIFLRRHIFFFTLFPHAKLHLHMYDLHVSRKAERKIIRSRWRRKRKARGSSPLEKPLWKLVRYICRNFKSSLVCTDKCAEHESNVMHLAPRIFFQISRDFSLPVRRQDRASSHPFNRSSKEDTEQATYGLSESKYAVE